MQDLSKTCQKLVKALNVNGADILFNKKQFMGTEGLPHNLYSISKAYWDDSKGKYGSNEIYKSTSMIRIVLYLRDMLYLEQGRELPMDNEMWNALRPEELRVLQEESMQEDMQEEDDYGSNF